MAKLAVLPFKVLWFIMVLPIMAVAALRLLLLKRRWNKLNLKIRDPAYMEQVIEMPIDREIWQIALERTQGRDAARPYSEYASIKKHQLEH
jgi:hypothetical protein